jgi:hypothetical protein
LFGWLIAHVDVAECCVTPDVEDRRDHSNGLSPLQARNDRDGCAGKWYAREHTLAVQRSFVENLPDNNPFCTRTDNARMECEA